MSIRLSVVLSQTAGNSPRQRDFESEVVARLIAAAGIDLSLIGSIASLETAATDRLMLDGLRGDLALLSWFAPEVAADHLATAGIDGRRAPHRLDAEAVNASQTEPTSTAPLRRIYYFDLGTQASPTSLQAAIEELLASRRVVTFTLGSGATPTPPSAARKTSSSGDRPTTLPLIQPPEIRAADESSRDTRAASAEVDSDRWDVLVDELNDSDI